MTLSRSNQPEAAQRLASRSSWLVYLSWALALGMTALMIYFILARTGVVGAKRPADLAVVAPDLGEPPAIVQLPVLDPTEVVHAVLREANSRTIVPTRPREDVVTYTVEAGDSVFGIAQNFNLEPESVLWANYEVLNDDPQMISIGQELYIPPTNGVLYKWKDGDTVDKVAGMFKASPEDMLLWPGNNIDITNPVFTPEQLVMIPGGEREFRTWLVPTIPRGAAGVNPSIYGPGACDTSAGGAFGSGTFIYPAPNHVLSGNDYWGGHLGLDFAAFTGDPIYATDSGLVVYSGPIGGGYGIMVMVDHGNGYQSLYAHLSGTNVRCGASVRQGTVIGRAGSTGNSTGPHLHFEIRYLGGFINPWYVLQ